MDSFRTLAINHLRRSLRLWEGEDRLVVAWTMACGRVLAERAKPAQFEEGTLTVAVYDEAWLPTFQEIERSLAQQLAEIAGVPVTGIHFEVKKEPAKR